MIQYDYETIQTPEGRTIILRSDGAFIPLDEGNSDYQRYLRHLSGQDENGTLS